VSLAREVADWLRGVVPAEAALVADSRQVRPGDVFFAYPGTHGDGRSFVAQALTRGARAVVAEVGALPDLGAVPERRVPDLKRWAGPIAAAFYGDPSTSLDIVAVTGTNGKTSCTHWIAQGCDALGRAAGVMGTLGIGRLGQLDAANLTTPDALSVQASWARLRAAGVTTVAVEASSIGLHQHRLDGTRVRAAVLTNLTRDHLDYHGSMMAYEQAKSRLFAWPDLAVAVVNLDDPAYRTMLAATRSGARRIGYTLGAAPGPVDEILRATGIAHTPRGTRFELNAPWGSACVETSLLGRFNVANLLAVAASWMALGWTWDEVVVQIGAVRPVSGRMQTLGGDAECPLVVIDYAHTPDALAKVLAALRPVAQTRGGAVWCVVGAGGDRDSGKRPEMGAAVEAGADRVVLTSDNPRHESPECIVAALKSGMRHPPALVDVDRAAAIGWALAQAAPVDVVLIAGKGHETYQEIAGVRHPFSDVAQARSALARRVPSGVKSGAPRSSGSGSDVA
jgi:UDP-N-acetylmuramoyl-L-alanyl-D-glutamate--2,6-diaminopimelate ligase